MTSAQSSRRRAHLIFGSSSELTMALAAAAYWIPTQCMSVAPDVSPRPSCPERIFIREITGEFERILADQPIAITTLFPLGKIDLIDRTAIENLPEDAF